MVRIAINILNVNVLKELLRERGLITTGNKNELIIRLSQSVGADEVEIRDQVLRAVAASDDDNALPTEDRTVQQQIADLQNSVAQLLQLWHAQNVPQNIQQNVSQSVQQNVSQNVQQNVPLNVQQNETQNVQQNVPQNVQQNVPLNIQQNEILNVQQNETQNVQQNVVQNEQHNELINLQLVDQSNIQCGERLPTSSTLSSTSLLNMPIPLGGGALPQLTARTAGTTSREQRRDGSVKEIAETLPEFDPTDDRAISVTEFVDRVNASQRAHFWNERGLLLAVYSKLKGAARLWFDSMDEFDTCWEALSQKLIDEFGSTSDEAEVHKKTSRALREPGEKLNDYCFRVAALERKHNLSEQALEIESCRLQYLPQNLAH